MERAFTGKEFESIGPKTEKARLPTSLSKCPRTTLCSQIEKVRRAGRVKTGDKNTTEMYIVKDYCLQGKLVQCDCVTVICFHMGRRCSDFMIGDLNVLIGPIDILC